MRTDGNLARDSFRFSEEWKRSSADAPLTPQIDRRLQGGRLEDGRYVVHSLSGGERNHYFTNRGGRTFEDLSALSGLDTPADSRGFVLLDYDHDGWQDIALVNANEPLFSLYRNELGLLQENRGKNAIAIRFVGGASSATNPDAKFACRDGYGAMVTADLGGLTLVREHRCGEGFGVQNSATMVIGIGAREEVPSLTVRWPSGKSSTIPNVAAGSLLTIYEDPARAPGGSPATRQNYYDQRKSAPSTPKPALAEFPLHPAGATAPIRVYTTMATWCAACKAAIPQTHALRSGLDEARFDLLGIPIDEDDDAEELRAYASEWNPAYRLLTDLAPAERRAVSEFLEAQTGEAAALPTTIVTDADGRVLAVTAGVPDVSQVRKLAAQH